MPRKTKSTKVRQGQMTLGLTRARGASLAILAAGGIGLAACGSSGSSNIAGPPPGVSANSTSTTVAPTTTVPPGFKNGFWVGTGSATDQEIVYVAKEGAFLTALGQPPAAAQYFTPSLWASAKVALAKQTSEGIVFVPGSNTSDPGGIKPAAFTITQPPTTPSGTNMTVATVQICSIDTAYGEYKSTGKPVPGPVGETGPELTTVNEELFAGKWLITNASGQAVSSCPAGHSLGNA
ncbi:MAG: hypothetical protein M0Z91_07500 [Actinomycetota bacterium]|nr:hypothetical protein [Actinomycetota bacterium]